MNSLLNDFYMALREKPREQRLGQFFCNTYKITDSELFYETDETVAWKRINYWIMLGGIK